jgi:hypothetical protein
MKSFVIHIHISLLQGIHMSQIDLMLQHFIMLTSKELERSFDPEEAKEILSFFSQRFRELFEKLKVEENYNETELFFGINPVFVIALEEALPGKHGQKDVAIVTRLVLAIYKTMLEEMVLEPQRRYLTSSKDPWATFVEDIRKGNQKIYDNEFFRLQQVSVSEKEFAFDINRCFFQEVFQYFERQDLGPIMCDYDSLIADNIAKWVRFEREETIAAGCNRCTFRYYNIKQKFSNNPTIDSLYTFLQIIDDSDEMLTKQEIIDKGFDEYTDLEDIIKLYELVKNHSGIRTSTIDEELMIGNVNSYKRHEEWKLLFNRKISKDERAKIIRNLPLILKEEKIIQLITDILENPYEHASIKWMCLNYLQHHFSSRVGFEAEGVDEYQVKAGLLEEFRRNFPKISFEARSTDNSKISIQAFGKGEPEYKLKEPIQLLRKKVVNDFPDAGISPIKPVISTDPVAKKFFDIFGDSLQSFQLRELALRILISRVGREIIPFLNTVAENTKDSQFLRGRAIDSLSWFTGTLPHLYTTIKDFIYLPDPVKRSIVDFVARQGTEEDLLLKVANNEIITTVIRVIAIRNLQTYQDPKVTAVLLDLAVGQSVGERARQASLEALGYHDVDEKGKNLLLKVFTDPKETTFIRMEAFETLKELSFKPKEEIEQLEKTDWITDFGMKQLMEG